MEDHVNTPSTPPSPTSVGEQLRAAREAQGLSLGDIAAQTRVAERHLISIEENRFTELAAPTYAVGFSRSYARAVGLNESEIAARVRRQIDAQPVTRGPTLPSFEPGDPARVPPSRIAWFAGLLAVVVVGVLLVYWNDFLSPEGDLPDLLPEATQTQGAAPVAAVPNAPPAVPVVAPGGPVVLTATGPAVWVKVTDANGNQLFQKELAQGESWTVPPEAQSPQLRTARPDKLQITVGGRALPPLGDKPEVISGVLLTPAALIQRTAGAAGGSAVPDSLTSGPRNSGAAPAMTADDPQGALAPLAPPGAAQDSPLSTTQQ